MEDLAGLQNKNWTRDSHRICIVVLDFLVEIKQELIFIMVELKPQDGNHPRRIDLVG